MGERGRPFHLAMMVLLIYGGCEKVVGIHASMKRADAGVDARDTGADGGGDADAHADAAGEQMAADAMDGGAEVRPATDAAGDEAPVDGLSGDQVDAAGDGGATADAVSDGGIKADGSGDGSSDQATGALCGADPSVATPIKATAFRFTAGPNNGNQGGKGSCGFPNALLPKGMYFGAVETALYATAARCGTCMRVEAGGVKVEVQVIDVVQPLAGAHGSTITIDSGAQAQLGPGGGNPDVQVSFVPCTVSGNIQLGFIGSQDPSVVVMNHRNQLQSVQLVTATATLAMTRQSYNSWTPPTGFIFGGGSVALQLTDAFGNSVRTSTVPVSTTWADAGQQFPVCPQ